MKLKALIIMASLAVIFYASLRLIELQDSEYERYSEQAVESCMNHKEKTLSWNKKLRYFTCN